MVEKLFRVENCIPESKKRNSHALRNLGSFPSDPDKINETETRLTTYVCTYKQTAVYLKLSEGLTVYISILKRVETNALLP